MEHVWTVLCRLSVIDDRRKNVSLIEALEKVSFSVTESELEVHPTGAFPFQAELVSYWIRSDLDAPERARVRILVVSPERKTLNPEGFEYRVDLTEDSRFRSMAHFGTLPYTGDGIYRFEVQYFDEDQEQWLSAASIPLEIVMEIVPSSDE